MNDKQVKVMSKELKRVVKWLNTPDNADEIVMHAMWFYEKALSLPKRTLETLEIGDYVKIVY